MRILRIRRGYTTNSSGGNEWVPPANVQPGGATGQAGAANGASGTRSNWEEGLFAASPAAKHVTVLATQPLQAPPVGASATSAAQPAPRSDRSSGNLGLMGGLLGAVCLLFVVTGLIRRALSKGEEGR